MNLAEFLEARRPAWRELEAGLRTAESRDAATLPHDRARRLVDLHRRASADLIQARTYGGGLEACAYLEALVGRGHALLHPPPRLAAFRGLWGFFRITLPATVRRESAAMALAAGALLFGAVLGGAAVALDPEGLDLFKPAWFKGISPSERVHRDEEAQRAGDTPGISAQAGFSSFLFTHNIQCSIIAFAVGVAWGLPTLLYLAFNGLMLGALAVEYFQDGQGLFFLGWILPHGIPELTCLVLAGAAGLLLGRGVLWPRGVTRAQQIRLEARRALPLLGGSAALLIPTGVMEGTLSQMHGPLLPYGLKIGMALVLGLLLHAYLWLMPLGAHQSAPEDLSAR